MKAREMISCKVNRYSAAENIFVADEKLTAIEIALEIFLNGKKFSECFCSPGDVEDLIIGSLAQAGKLRSIDDVEKISVDAANFVANVTTNQRGIDDDSTEKNFSRDVRFVAKEILNCADKLLSELSTTHDKTNGVHSGILSDGKKILVFREDVGRHNVFDKLHGWSIRNRVDLTDKIIIFSGRCSCEMIQKLARMKIPAVLAKSVPTTLSISLANKFGITLAARLAAGSFCIYTNPQRIVLS